MFEHISPITIRFTVGDNPTVHTWALFHILRRSAIAELERKTNQEYPNQVIHIITVQEGEEIPANGETSFIPV